MSKFSDAERCQEHFVSAIISRSVTLLVYVWHSVAAPIAENGVKISLSIRDGAKEGIDID